MCRVIPISGEWDVFLSSPIGADGAWTTVLLGIDTNSQDRN